MVSISDEEKTMAALAHGLGALINLLSVGTLAWVPALVIWLMKRGESRYIDFQAKQALAFWIAIPLSIWVLKLLGIITLIGWLITWPVAGILWFCASCYGFVGAVQCYAGRNFEYEGIADLVR